MPGCEYWSNSIFGMTREVHMEFHLLHHRNGWMELHLVLCLLLEFIYFRQDYLILLHHHQQPSNMSRQWTYVAIFSIRLGSRNVNWITERLIHHVHLQMLDPIHPRQHHRHHLPFHHQQHMLIQDLCQHHHHLSRFKFLLEQS